MPVADEANDEPHSIVVPPPVAHQPHPLPVSCITSPHAALGAPCASCTHCTHRAPTPAQDAVTALHPSSAVPTSAPPPLPPPPPVHPAAPTPADPGPSRPPPATGGIALTFPATSSEHSRSTDVAAASDVGIEAVNAGQRVATVFSLASFQTRAHDRAQARPNSGPAHGGDNLCTKLLVIVAAVSLVATSYPEPCDQPLREWMLTFAGGLAAYIVFIRALHVLLRPRNPELQETLAYAVYVLMYPVTLAWLLTGAYFSFRVDKCPGGLLRVSSYVLTVIAILYIVLLGVFVTCAAVISMLMAPTATARSMNNVLRNRLPNAAPAASMRALKTAKYSEDLALADTTCAICIEVYRENDTVVFLDCEPNTPHVFHKSCIQLWFSRSSTCPLCKRNI